MTQTAATASSAQAELLNRIDKIPQRYFGEVVSFLGYLQHKAQQEAVVKEQRAAREKAAFIRYAEELNAEAEDVLKYQVPLFEGEDNE